MNPPEYENRISTPIHCLNVATDVGETAPGEVKSARPSVAHRRQKLSWGAVGWRVRKVLEVFARAPIFDILPVTTSWARGIRTAWCFAALLSELRMRQTG